MGIDEIFRAEHGRILVTLIRLSPLLRRCG